MDTKDERSVRFECLNLAVNANPSGYGSEQILRTAQKYFDFVDGQAPAVVAAPAEVSAGAVEPVDLPPVVGAVEAATAG